MTKILYSFDPSTVATGYARWVDGKISVVDVITADGLDDMISRIHERFEGMNSTGLEAVVETPTHYKHDRAPAKIVRQLVLVAGACRAHFRTSTSVTPAQWNRGKPKNISELRIKGLLSPSELAIVMTVPANVRDNAFDAVGVGLFHLKRMR